MRVLLADSLHPSAASELERLGLDVVSDPGLTADALAGALAGFEALVVRSTRVPASAVDAADRLALVVRAGAGVENIDLDAASSRGVYVCNVPGRNAVAVAELALGLMLAVDRHIPDAVADLRSQRWRKSHYGGADGLLGKSLGIVGLGAIGLAVAERAKAFGLVVHGLRRPNRSPDTEVRLRQVGVRLVDSLPDLFDLADIVSLHVPGGPATRGLVGEALLDRLDPGDVLINTARADVVDTPALLTALDRGVLAGIDVFPDEPGSGEAPFASPLAEHPNVVGTHHIGASTAQAQRSVADGVVEVIAAYVAGRLENCVNLETSVRGPGTIVVRHLDRVGVLARVLDVLGRADLNVGQMENQLFDGGAAAAATIHVSGPVDATLASTVRALPDVLGVTTIDTELGI